MGVLKKITGEYFGDTIRKEDEIDISDLDVEIVSFTDRNKKHHYRGYRVVDSDNPDDMAKTLTKLIERIIGERGNECDLNDIDVSNIKKMNFKRLDSYRGVFEDSNFNGDISGWDTSNVEDMSHMFCYATKFNQQIGNWNVGNVRNMSRMFSGAKKFNQPIGGWDVKNVRKMSRMFWNTRDFNQYIGGWDVINVNDVNGMFCDAESFDQDISSWKASKELVKYNMDTVFLNCPIKKRT